MGNYPRLKIALCTYSTNPRGGVIHTLALAEQLQILGQEVHIFALEKEQNSAFPRVVQVPYTLIPTNTPQGVEPLDERIQRYIHTYFEYFLNHPSFQFNIYHAQDCISANALWMAREAGQIPFFIRTIHHLDDFTSPALIKCQNDSVYRPDYKIAVSRTWQERLASEFEINARVFFNGVDLNRFHPARPDERTAIRKEAGLTGKFVCLHIGGILPRKNNIRLLQAFKIARQELKANGVPCVLLMAGGTTLLDYKDYEEEFIQELRNSGLTLGEDISLLGSVSDTVILKLYRSADLLVFPSLKEGWGLATLEAMASGLPVLTSDIPVFREYLQPDHNAILVDPLKVASIASGIVQLASDDSFRERLKRNGISTASNFSWETTARHHLDFYTEIIHTRLEKNASNI